MESGNWEAEWQGTKIVESENVREFGILTAIKGKMEMSGEEAG